MFSIHLRDMEISITLTCLCRFSQMPDFSATLLLSFSFRAKPAVFWKHLEIVTAACLAAPGSPASLPIHALCCGTPPQPFQAILQVSKTARKPLQVHDTHMGWVFSTSQEQAAFDGSMQACSMGVSRGFRFRGILCHNMGCFLECVFETVCLPATCDCCWPNRVQDRQGSPANTNTLKKVISAHPQRLTFSTEHMALLHH